MPVVTPLKTALYTPVLSASSPTLMVDAAPAGTATSGTTAAPSDSAMVATASRRIRSDESIGVSPLGNLRNIQPEKRPAEGPSGLVRFPSRCQQNLYMNYPNMPLTRTDDAKERKMPQ